MYIDSITLEGFRNYRLSRGEFTRGVNVIKGDNAQGKTNLVEAMYLISTGRSFRARSDKELIGFDAEGYRLTAACVSGGRDRRVEMTSSRVRRRDIRVNGVKLKTASELANMFAAVLFCPRDPEIVRGGAAERRRLMDLAISQLRPRYAKALQEFNRAYEGKTRILRDLDEKPSLLELLDEYNYRLAEMGAELIHYRAAFIKRMAEECRGIHAEFSGGEELEIEYQTVKTVEDPLRPASEILPALLEHQRSHRAAELASRLCLSGAHKDDLSIKINGADARAYASQGQARTAALSIKLAELKLHRDHLGEYPVLLLDDVLSELDPGRQDFILNRIGGGQVFITCCEDDRIAKRTGGAVLTVENGNICQK